MQHRSARLEESSPSRRVPAKDTISFLIVLREGREGGCSGGKGGRIKSSEGKEKKAAETHEKRKRYTGLI